MATRYTEICVCGDRFEHVMGSTAERDAWRQWRNLHDFSCHQPDTANKILTPLGAVRNGD